MNIQSIRLDLDKRVTVTEHVVIGQGDKGGTTIVAHIFDHGVAYDLTDKSAMFEMRLPRQSEYVRDNCTVSGNTITYIVDEEHVAAVYGTTDCAYFDILIGDSVIASTARFTIDILRSARDGAEPAASWDAAVDELIERGEQAVSDAEQAVSDATSAINAANQAIARIEPTIEQAAEDAAEQATADAEQRIQDAIDAVGEISELAVPLMSADVRGGAKLEQHGGLALRDGALGIGSLVQESDGYARGGLAEVTAEGHAEQFSTTGKNLLPKVPSVTTKGITFATNPDGSVTVNGTATGDAFLSFIGTTSFIDGNTYTLSGCPAGGSTSTYEILVRNTIAENRIHDYGSGATFAFDPNSQDIRIVIRSGTTVSDLTFYPQLELGSTATEYEPYTGGAPSPSPNYAQEIQVVSGHEVTGKTGRFVDLIVKQGNTTLTTTPIPLPQRGWVAGLPDGTADSLRIDGAGKVEWELKDAETTTAATDGVTGTIGVDVLSTTGQIADGATVLYKLATPVTEDCGYVDMPAIPSDATVTIPELDALGIRYFVDDTVTQYGREIYARVRSEYADRITALEQAVAELATS